MHYKRVRKGAGIGTPGPVERGDCSIAGCPRKANAKGLCDVHYQRKRRTGSTDKHERVRAACSVDGCDAPAQAQKLCSKHYQRLRATGSTDEPCRPARTCSVVGCDEPYVARGLCRRHWKQWAYWRDVEASRRQQRQWRRANGELARKRARDHRERNGEGIRAAEKARYAANPERRRAGTRRYRERHPEKVAAARRRWAEENPKARAAYFAEYQRRNLMKRRGSNAKRKAWLRTTQVEPVSYERVVAEHGMICHLCCGEIASYGDLHIDHVIPRERGGTHTYDNLRPAHKLCNLRKGTSLMSELTWVRRAA
jgi:5-methylcytosine-specific restriction endonuclease McrA